jgi:uncharacterized HAD superfamily protein
MKYVIDIDGTICIEDGKVVGRSPYKDRIKQINTLYDEGHTIVYITARGLESGRGETHYRPITEQQLKEWGCKYHELSFKNHDADIFIDDKAINSEDFFSE